MNQNIFCAGSLHILLEIGKRSTGVFILLGSLIEYSSSWNLNKWYPIRGAVLNIHVPICNLLL